MGLSNNADPNFEICAGKKRLYPEIEYYLRKREKESENYYFKYRVIIILWKSTNLQESTNDIYKKLFLFKAYLRFHLFNNREKEQTIYHTEKNGQDLDFILEEQILVKVN